MTQPGPWVDGWLSPPRFAVYLAQADNDRRRALELYELNTCLSAAYMHDLAHLEVALRNAYDRAITSHRPAGAAHWVFDADALFPPHMTTADDGTPVDSNARTREQIATAVLTTAAAERLRMTRSSRAAKQSPTFGPIRPSPGHVVAELTFGFWRYFTKSAHEKRLWVPYLHHAFVPGTDRKAVDQRVTKLNDLRNRVAHHEPLNLVSAEKRHRELLDIADWLSPDLRDYIADHSTCHTYWTHPAS